MGIDIETFVIFGVIFSYEDLKKINQDEITQVGARIGCSDIIHIWEEMHESGGYSIRPYYDCEQEYCEFAFGVKFKGANFDRWYAELDKDQVRADVQSMCAKYGLKFKEPKTHITVNVW